MTDREVVEWHVRHRADHDDYGYVLQCDGMTVELRDGFAGYEEAEEAAGVAVRHYRRRLRAWAGMFDAKDEGTAVLGTL